MRSEVLHTRVLWLIMLVGFVMRVAYALEQPTLVQFSGATGGDSSGYLVNGAGFFSGQEHGRIRGLPFYISNIKTAPLYIIFVGIFQPLLPDHETIIAIRFFQCLASIATVYVAGRLAFTIAGGARAGIIAAALMAFHPAFVTEPANIATETLYIFFVALGLWLYVEYVAGPVADPQAHRLSGAMTLAAAAFGLATLTRGVAALFPLVIALHLICLGRRRLLRRWRRHCLLLLAVYLAIVSSWTLYNLLNWNRLIIVSDQLMPALWRGAESRDGSPARNDELLLEGVDVDRPAGCVVDCKFEHATETYINKISAIISADFAGFIRLRAGELAYSISQPYGAAPFGDISVVEAVRQWAAADRSLGGLLQILRIEGFAIKLAFWLFHSIGLGFGLLGMFWSRRRWITAAPLAGFAFYTVGVHSLLLALPRYLFPVELVWLAFAGISSASLYERWRSGDNSAAENASK
ncbi:MAG: glycosyltransferase family 39 protein [Chloroflexota bacterium]|nr:glycosyltransferase family 39 protein [Chloroflexota bacterium]